MDYTKVLFFEREREREVCPLSECPLSEVSTVWSHKYIAELMFKGFFNDMLQ